MLEVGRISGTDTSWYTYTKSTPCAVSLNIGLLNAPILSSATLALWQANDATVAYEDDSTCIVTFEEPVGTTYNYYDFTVDKTRWLQTVLSITGFTRYHAKYLYDELQGLPVLRKVALFEDTTMGRGGVEFYDIEINGELPVVFCSTRPTMAAVGPRDQPRLLLGRHSRHPIAGRGSSAMYMLTGRMAASGAVRHHLGQQLLIEAHRVRIADP